MSKFNSLLTCILTTLFVAYTGSESGAAELHTSCLEIGVSWKVTHSTNSGANGSVILEFVEPRSNYEIHLISMDGKSKLKASESAVGGLKRGKYSIVITGRDESSNYCPKFFEVAIK